MAASDRIVVTKLRQTCEAEPSQWEGHTSMGRTIYARYRHGWLSVRLSEKRSQSIVDAVMGKEVFSRTLTDKDDGYLEYDRLKALTQGQIIWPKKVE